MCNILIVWLRKQCGMYLSFACLKAEDIQSFLVIGYIRKQPIFDPKDVIPMHLVVECKRSIVEGVM